ncbi:hypothetical protein GCM10009574_068510 [Streptomyces asiaticus]
MARAAASQLTAHVRLLVTWVGAPAAAIVCAVVSYQSSATDGRGSAGAATAVGPMAEAASSDAAPSANKNGRVAVGLTGNS